VDDHAIGIRRHFVWSVGIRREGRFSSDRSHDLCSAGQFVVGLSFSSQRLPFYLLLSKRGILGTSCDS
jgi:hypothetical protein